MNFLQLSACLCDRESLAARMFSGPGINPTRGELTNYVVMLSPA